MLKLKAYLIIKQFDLHVWIWSTSNIHFFQFASFQYGHWKIFNIDSCINLIWARFILRFKIFKCSPIVFYRLIFPRLARIWVISTNLPSTGCFRHQLLPNLSILQQARPNRQSSMAVGIHLQSKNLKISQYSYLDDEIN